MKLSSHYSATLRLGLPIAIAQLGTIILAFADTIMVGHYSTPALSAASFVNSLFNLATMIILGYSYGLTPFVSAKYSQDTKDKEHSCPKEEIHHEPSAHNRTHSSLVSLTILCRNEGRQSVAIA